MREISHFGSKGARVTVCVRKKPIWFDFLFCLGFYLLKREEKNRRKKKEERREMEKTGREGFKKIKVRKLP